MNLATFLADAALRYADKPAIYCGAQVRSFAQLNERSACIAAVLVEQGLCVGDRVALHLPNCIEAVELMCAVGRAGAVIVPISSRLAETEVHFILQDCEPRFVFHPDAVVPELKNEQHTQFFTIGDGSASTDLDVWVARGAGLPQPDLIDHYEDLVLGYTSGTTGNPKGAIGTHTALLIGSGLMTALEYGFSEADILLVTSPIAHRVGLSRIVNMMCSGMTTIVMERFDADYAIDLIEEHRVTTLSVVPTIARLLTPGLEAQSHRCGSLKRLLATGEAFPVTLKERLHRALPSLELNTSYAQTEAGLVSNLRPSEQLSRPDSIGRPIPGVEVRLVDEHLVDVGVSEPGEVLVRCGTPGSMMVMKGYFHRPDETNAVFVDGWLRTGDVCRRDVDGYLYFVDRLKDMIVSGGLNIYAKEVELAIVSLAGVADAAVVGVPDEAFGEAVHAFVELEKESGLTAEAIIEHCKTKLASYKKPRFVQFVSSMPRTASGKVKKQLLLQSHIN